VSASSRVGIGWSAGALAFLLALMVVGVVFLLGHRAQRLWRTELVELPTRVIPRTSEASVARLVATVDAIEGIDNHSFSIESDIVLVQLFDANTHRPAPGVCEGPDWVRTPGALALEQPSSASEDASGEVWEGRNLRVRWFWCESTPSALREAVRDHVLAFDDDPTLAEIWPLRHGPRDPDWVVDDSGLLRPAVEATGLEHEVLTILVFALGLAGALVVGMGFAGVLPGPSAGAPRSRTDPRWVVVATTVACIACIGLRFSLASDAGIDSDESWAKPIIGSIFHESHDAWVHPPLFHMLQQPWVRAIGWEPNTAIAWVRLPWLAFGLAATALVVAHALARRTAPWQLALLLPCLLAVDVAAEFILARPYPLATMLVVMVAFAAWAPWQGESRAGARLRWIVILLAAGLAMWTDLVAGLVAGGLVMVRVFRSPVPLRARAAVVAVLGLWALALVPGAAWASRYQVDPEAARATPETQGMLEPGHLTPGLENLDHLPALLTFGEDASLWPLGLLAIAALLALPILAHRTRTHRVEAWIPLVLVALAIAMSATLVKLRPRNVAFAPHLIAMFGTIVLARRPESPSD
jgi:hypothetical protein